MSYNLSAFVMKKKDFDIINLICSNVHAVILPFDMVLIPCNRQKFISESDIVDSKIEAAYIYASFFGGFGGQTCTVWRNGKVVFSEDETDEAINHTLEILGVPESDGKDRFDMVGLGKFRDTEDWPTKRIIPKHLLPQPEPVGEYI